ncbi:MAG: hypothetical protein JSV52_05295 [Candidatus Zixiibacteriota bacterium]|nr:MAG: hypothetical protein JSV52_05295 [candidate division Zixibacteria bacterium]
MTTALRTLMRAGLTCLLLSPLAQSDTLQPPPILWHPGDKPTDENILTLDCPAIEQSAHTVGKLQLSVCSNGALGSSLYTNQIDAFTGEWWPPLSYPKDRPNWWVRGITLSIGAIVGSDTMVSMTGGAYAFYETWPDQESYYGLIPQTVYAESKWYDEDAISEQDLYCVWSDTFDVDKWVCPFDVTCNHKPIGIKVRQRSMAWSWDYADDFVLVHYEIENISDQQITKAYFGLNPSPLVLDLMNPASSLGDDLTGFYASHTGSAECGFVDTLNIAYWMDNDGDALGPEWSQECVRNVVGVRFLQVPAGADRTNYNWWSMFLNWPVNYEFGPRRAHTEEDPFVEFDSGILGSPRTDRDRYYILSHPEIDYDQMYTAVDHTQEGWMPPPNPAYAIALANGYGISASLSIGPFDIAPGHVQEVTVAVVGGENVHVKPDDRLLFDPAFPDQYYESLDFSSLAENSLWASWIYDNPGFDTDGDGDSGSYRVCCADTIFTDTGGPYIMCDTFWYKGDGIPDFRGVSPPPAPELRIEPKVGSLTLRFNGLKPETTVNQFFQEIRFEGYRVYIGRDDRQGSMSLYTSYDRDDYMKFVFNIWRYEVEERVYTREELQQLYGDPHGIEDFDPLYFNEDNPFTPANTDSIFYFATVGYNQSAFGVDTPIRKSYPNQPYPSTLNPDDADPDELTEDGYFKYFEYELVIDDLLPTVPYYISVTAFDRGSTILGLASSESPISNNTQAAYPLASTEEVAANDLKVYVYPNPYRGDVDYQAQGFENRYGLLAPDRMHRIHFANLPPVCTIYIYSLDGDLVRKLEHHYPGGGPEAMHEEWNMITRNTQLVESGLYYWVVESEEGTQMGKLVIIK